MARNKICSSILLAVLYLLRSDNGSVAVEPRDEHELIRAIRANNLRLIKRILTADPALANAELACDIVPGLRTLPLHVALTLAYDPANEYSHFLSSIRVPFERNLYLDVRHLNEERFALFSFCTNTSTIEFLLAHGAKSDIWTACKLGRIDEVELFLKRDPKLLLTPNPLSLVLTTKLLPPVDKNDLVKRAFLPIHYAVMSENQALVEILIAAHRSREATSKIPSLLHLAIFRHNTQILKLLLESGLCDPNAPWIEGNNPLALAAEAGRVNAMKLLVRHGAKVQESRYWLSPLNCACREGHLDAAIFLLEKGADPNQELWYGDPDLKDVTSLESAYAFHHPEVGEYLLSKGAKWTFRAALRANDLEEVKKNFRSLNDIRISPGCYPPLELDMIRYGTIPILDFLVSQGFKFREVHLIEACKSGRLDMVKYIVRSGLNPRFNNNRDGCPIAAAAEHGHDKIVDWLIDYGSDPNLAFLASLLAPNTRCLDLLLANGGDLKRFGNKALELSVNKRFHASLLSLLAAGLDPDLIVTDYEIDSYYKNKGGSKFTPLQQACLNGDLTSVEILYRFKAKTGPSELDRHTPLHLAVRSRDAKMVEFWLNQSLDVNARDVRQRTPLHLAAEIGDLAIVDMLLDASSDPTLNDADGKTPLDLAREKKHKYIVFALESHVKAKK